MMFFKNKKLKKLEKELENNKRKLKKLKFQFKNLDEYLINSYNYPFIKPPYNKHKKKILRFMNYTGDFLINNVRNSDYKPLVSVLMPVYNREDVVLNAVDSVLNQSYDNIELIIVDDASEDKTASILDDINDSRVKVTHHIKNKHASGSRNTALKLSRGEIITYLDSDNIYDREYIECCVGAFMYLDDADAIYSAQYRHTTYDSKAFAIQYSSFNRSLLHNHNYIDMNCFAHKRHILDRITGFDESLKGADDWDFILKIANEYTIYSVPFLHTRCFTSVVDNRVSDSVATDFEKIRFQNEKIISLNYKLNKKVAFIISVEDDLTLKSCIESILELNLDFIEIIAVSKNKLNISQKNECEITLTKSFMEAIKLIDSSSDVIILNPKTILTGGCVEIMQKYSYDVDGCGLIVSTQYVKDNENIKKHISYAYTDYWCDITPLNKNIKNVAVFHNGEVLELKYAPFFCTYIKSEVLNKLKQFNITSYNDITNIVTHILELKIYHISKAIALRRS